MININVSLFIQIANFVLMIWILNLILYKPIRNMLKQRREKIEGLEQTIERANTGAKEKDAAYISGVKEARIKGLKEKEALMVLAAEEEKKVIAKINEKAAADLAEIREKIKKDVDDVRTSLQKEVDVFANTIGEKILGRAV